MGHHPGEMQHTTEDRRPAPDARGTRGGDRPCGPPGPRARGCLYALSQPPLMLFLAVVAGVVFLAAAHDLLLL